MTSLLQSPGTTENTNDPAFPPPDSTTLVPPRTPRNSPFTAVKLTDSRTALTRGLADYIATLVTETDDGRLLRFEQVFDVWAEPENIAIFPSAIAYTTSPGVYESKSLGGGLNSNCAIPAPDGRFLVTPAEYVVDITVEIWATDIQERMLLVSAMEDLFNPFIGQYGFTLQLPHYHNVRATYELLQMGYMDSETSAIRRDRRAVFTLSGSVPVVKLVIVPTAKPSVTVVVEDGNVQC